MPAPTDNPERDAESPPADMMPIRAVSALTGVNPVTLRAWERRYQLIRPVRTDTGHRLYTREDIDRIQKAQGLLDKGISISQAAKLINQGPSLTPETKAGPQVWRAYREQILQAIAAFDEPLLESIYQQALAHHPVRTVTRMLVIPSMEDLGARWREVPTGIVEEHFFSVFLRNKLGARFHHRSHHNTGPLLLCACLPGETHEIGLLLFALAASESNYRQILLGANVPLAELPLTAQRAGVDAIVLSGKIDPSTVVLANELPQLVQKAGVPVLIGGDMSVTSADAIIAAGAIPLGSEIDKSLQIVGQYLHNHPGQRRATGARKRDRLV